ncbi:MAG TPA: serine hydrolase [Solirubrobacteraceae bacterium]|nr:serine hydrolase [Solirubrobacteraceae bacterium]
MSGPQYLDTAASRARRHAKERRRRGRRRLALLSGSLAVVLLLGVLVAKAGDGDDGTRDPAQLGRADPQSVPERPPSQEALGPLPADADVSDPTDAFTIPFKKPPRAGIVVNVDTGEVLWRRNPERTLPIASLTKMMTARVTAELLEPDDRARITPAVLRYTGSGVGVLPKNKRVKVEPLLHGLMLPSGNDAARALAFRAAGSISGMVRRMNTRAAEMGLRCTRFAGVEGLSPGNRSCALDLVALARQVLRTKRIARIVRKRSAILPFPIKGGKLYLYNHNPLLRMRYRGTLGIKTGYTSEAGRCLVAAVRRDGATLVAVVLHSPDPGRQARKLLDAGFRAVL